MQQQTVANQAAVDENVDGIAIALLHLRAGEEAGEAEGARWAGRSGLAAILGDGFGGRHVGRRNEHFALARADFHQFVEHLAAEDLIDALSQRADRGHVEQFGGTAGEFERLIGMRQAVMRNQRGDVREFGLLGAQELAPRGDVIEEVAHGDGGAAAVRGFLARSILPPAISMRVPVVSSGARVSSSSRETDAMEGSASPRNPRVEMESRSLTSRSLLVAWRSKASRASSRIMPQPSSTTRMRRRPPDSTSTRIRWRRHRASFRGVP